MFYEVLPAKVFRKSSDIEAGILTYAYDKNLKPGALVSVPLGKKTVLGIVYKKVAQPDGDYKIKSITSVLYDKPLPDYLLKSIIWLSSFYLCPMPQVVSLFLPNTLEKRHTLPAPDKATPLKDLDIPLNTAQKRALKELKTPGESSTKLLHGITGSGKTNIYLSLATETFKRGESTILLVPEIALTSQLVQVFSKTFGKNVVLIHSKQTDKTRRETWEKTLLSSSPKIVIGPRSALFLPLENLGLIIIDEAHEFSYFQEQNPKYHALRLASFMAKQQKVPCIFGTATPLASDYYLAKSHNSVVTLSEKAKSTSIKPNIKIVDFKDRAEFDKNRYFSLSLLNQIDENLKNGYQTLIYHNRRGSAPLTICENCGYEALCPNCFLPLTLHSDLFKMVCHTCGFTTKIPTSCPECKHPDIIHKGFGTKLLEAELKRLYKNAKIVRFDTDNDKNSSLDQLYDDVKDGKYDIIIGTQTIARGLDLPKLATVGVVQADSGLSLPDYSSEERTFHLLTQVIGRIGRGHTDKANAIIQTYKPDSPVITFATNSDYTGFYDYIIKKRQKSHLPPFYHLAKISVVYKTEKTTLNKIKLVHKALRDIDGLYLSAPTPAFHEHTNTGYTWQIILKAANRQTILKAIKTLDQENIRFYLDPPTLLS